jgi:hypothetical protein
MFELSRSLPILMQRRHRAFQSAKSAQEETALIFPCATSRRLHVAIRKLNHAFIRATGDLEETAQTKQTSETSCCAACTDSYCDKVCFNLPNSPIFAVDFEFSASNSSAEIEK